MRAWPLLAATTLLGCNAFPFSGRGAAASRPAPPAATAADVEGRHATECARGVVARGQVVRVGPSHYRGRPVVVVSLSSPEEGLVGAYYGSGPGCDLVAMVGGVSVAAEVQPGAPFRSLSDARRSALNAHNGVVTAWALERDRGPDGRWAYRFDVDTGGGLQAVFVDAVNGRPARAEATSRPPPPPALAPEPSAPAMPPRARNGDPALADPLGDRGPSIDEPLPASRTGRTRTEALDPLRPPPLDDRR